MVYDAQRRGWDGDVKAQRDGLGAADEWDWDGWDEWIR